MEEKAIQGIGVPIYDPQGKFLGYVMVNEKLEVSHSLQFGYKISKEEKEMKTLIKNEINKALPQIESALLKKITDNLLTLSRGISQTLDDK